MKQKKTRYNISACRQKPVCQNPAAKTFQNAMEALTTTSGLLDFAESDVKNAPLKCSTELNSKLLSSGFTAENIFYCDEILPVNYIVLLHDQSKIEISAMPQNGLRIIIEMGYASFGRLNFEMTEFLDKFKILLTINVNYTPVFYELTQSNGWKHKINPAAKDFKRKALWESFIHATAFQIEFILTKSATYTLLNQLYNKSGCKISYKYLQTTDFDRRNLLNFVPLFNQRPFNTRYMVEAIVSCGTVGSFFLDYVIVKRGRNPTTEEAAKKLFTSMYEHLSKDLSLSSLEFLDLDLSAKNLENEHFVLMKTVYVTPTKTVLTLEEPTMTCRTFRMLGKDNLVQIKFRSDAFTRFPYELAEDTILPICQNGIVMAGKQFFELGGSHSLFCEAGAYFYGTDHKKIISEWHKSLGSFKAAPAATLAARLGLHFTSAWNTGLQMRISKALVIPDITSSCTDAAGKEKPYIFTDGNGLISRLFAQQIKNRLGLSYIPSAFQIRYAGFKGMLTVDHKDHRLIDNDGKYSVLFRQSQKKFDVSETEPLDFDIVEWAKPATFNLHQTFIAMLDSLAAIDEKQKRVRRRLRKLNRDACYETIKPLVDKTAFFQKLEQLPKYFPIKKMQTKDLMNESFLRSMLEANAILEAKMLASKSQIPLSKELARSAFGIADHTGKLKPGQVYFQYTEQLSMKGGYGKTIIKTGRVGVTRSPIYNPGDIRFYEAVDIPELRNYINVLIFPTVGDRPHPDEMGGGDLDGDTYAIYWDEALLLDNNVPAGDYSNPDAKGVTKISIDKLQDEHPIFRAEHQKNRNLESISNSHRVHLLTHDPRSVEFQELLKNADVAVNYSKRGLAGRPLLNNEKHFFWPNFMEKTHEPTFTTPHILCEMYHQSNTWYQLIRIAQEEAEKRRNLETVVLPQVSVDLYFTELFKKYKSEIQALMSKHLIKTEGELFANAFTGTLGALNTTKMPLINESSDTAAIVQNQVYDIFKRYRTTLLDLFSNTWKEDMEKKKKDIFSYKFSYFFDDKLIKTAQQLYSLAKEDKTCYSFPWLLWEGLDLWWYNKNDEPKRVVMENMIEKGLSKINTQPDHFIRDIPTDVFNNLTSRGIIPLKWYANFVKLCEAWTLSENLDKQKVLTTFQKYIKKITSDIAEDKRAPIESVIQAFTDFMVYYVIDNQATETSSSYYKVAQATLIKLAFMPEADVLKGINLRKQIIDFPCFVIQIPERWVEIFQQNLEFLEFKSGCNKIAIRKIKTSGYFFYFSIMSRGTLESCQKLKAMLTPKIDITLSTSMADTKTSITRQMARNLEAIFKQPSPPIVQAPYNRFNQR